MTTLFLDLETAPAAWTLDRGLRAAFDAVPSNYTKPESIAKWVEEHAADAWLKTPLDPHQGAIACIGWAVDGGPVSVAMAVDPHREERTLIGDWWETVRERHDVRLWCGHGLKGFDLPYLMRKAIRLGLWDLARAIPWARHGDKYREDEKRVIDTRDLWRGSAYNASAVGLDDIATFLGLRTKGEDGMHGSEVWRHLDTPEGRAAVIAYCRGDVERARDIAVRLWRAGVIRADWVWAEAPAVPLAAVAR